MKTLLWLLLLTVTSLTQAKTVNPEYLIDGNIERVTKCTQGKQKVQCVYTRKDEKLYKLYIDHKDVHSIYWISPLGDVLVWSRSSV